jgi:hypothetical protein
MRITRTRLGVMMAVACFCFGCKGAGGAFKVAAAGAVVAARVGGAIAAASAGSDSSDDSSDTPVQGPGETVADPSAHPQCVELTPMPEVPGALEPVRTVACGRHVLVQDAETGMWREKRAW